MRRLIAAAGLAVFSACAGAMPQPEPTVSPSVGPEAALRVNPAPATMPADCLIGRPDLVVDVNAALNVPTTATQVERLTNPLGNRPVPDAIVLAQLTMHSQDRNGNWIDRRPAWVVYRTGEMNKLPSGGPVIPWASPTTRPVYRSTASITAVDALTGEVFWAMMCGIVRVSYLLRIEGA